MAHHASSANRYHDGYHVSHFAVNTNYIFKNLFYKYLGVKICKTGKFNRNPLNKNAVKLYRLNRYIKNKMTTHTGSGVAGVPVSL